MKTQMIDKINAARSRDELQRLVESDAVYRMQCLDITDLWMAAAHSVEPEQPETAEWLRKAASRWYELD